MRKTIIFCFDLGPAFVRLYLLYFVNHKIEKQKTASCVFVQLLVADRDVRDQAATLFNE